MRNFIFLITLIAFTLYKAPVVLAQRIMVTWVGNGAAGYNGDGLVGSATQINAPQDLCVDAAHNLYFLDQSNNRVRMVSAFTGLVSTLASITSPQYMCMDGSGNLYVTAGLEIYQINIATAATTTFAGTGVSGHSGDGGPAIAAQLSAAKGICIDATGNIYCVDGNYIRKIAAATHIISTIAGTAGAGGSDGGPASAASLGSPCSICVDGSGNIFFSDHVTGISGSIIREIYAATGIINKIAGLGGSMASGDGGPAMSAGLGGVYGLCTDHAGNLYLCDVSCSCREIDMSTGIINTVAGSLYDDGYNGDGANALTEDLNWPYGVFVDGDGSIYVADGNNNRLRKAIQLTHTPSFAFGEGQTVSACTGVSSAIQNALAITDIDAGQSETWSIVSGPANGVLSGFPYTGMSNGTDSITNPHGLFYTSTAGYLGADSFKISVSDGAFSDIVTVHVKLENAPNPGVISGTSTGVCVGSAVNLTESVPGGSWSVTNPNATAGGAHITGVAVGTDTLIYTVTTACSSTTTASIIIKPWLDPGVITGFDNVCLGSTITLSESVAGGTWHSSTPSVMSVSATGVVTGMSLGTAVIVYSVTAPGCTGSTSDPIIVAAPAGAISGSNIVCSAASITLSDATTGGTWNASNGNAIITGTGATAIVTGLLAGVDTIYYVNTDACGAGYVALVVSVDPAPVTGTISGLLSVCAGSSGTINETATGGVWSITNSNATIDASGMVAGLVPGIDTILYTVFNSCSSAAASAVITIDSMISAGNISGTNTINAGSTATLADPVSGGTWSSTNTAISLVSGGGMVYGVAPGVDSIIYSLSNACGTSNAYFYFTVTDEHTTGINNTGAGETSSMIIAPNPAKEQVSIKVLSSYSEPVTILVTNVLGEKLMTIKGFTNQPISEFIGFPAGTYILSASGEHEQLSSKIVKE